MPTVKSSQPPRRSAPEADGGQESRLRPALRRRNNGMVPRPIQSAVRGCSYSQSPAPVAQPDRASVYETEGHRFESCRARFGSGSPIAIAA
jgi:hypothetical protein